MIPYEDALASAKIFFIARFGEEKFNYSRKHGYFNKWIDRFSSGNPETFMDSKSQFIFNELILRGKIIWLELKSYNYTK